MLSELTTDQKGAIAESAIVHEAIKLGIGVYKPLFEGGRYDLIFDLGMRLCGFSASGRSGRVRSSSCVATRAAGHATDF